MTIHRPEVIALQLWTVRDALAADPDRALAGVRAAGFDAVEVAPLPPGLSATDLKALLDRHGLAVVSIHGDLPTSAGFQREADLFGCRRWIWHGWPRDDRFDTLDGVRDLVARYNEAAVVARDGGIELGLHNHWWEFESVGGSRPIEVFHQELDPDIFFQIDVYWAQTAGADPVAVLREFAPRVRSLHLKDGPARPGEPMTALGAGVVDIAAITGHPLPHPASWVVELDECATDPLLAARQSRAFLRSLG